ncbi:hypothetical protein H257_07886 [Aphanomyces astaci]|uniref:Uncharacterized protein n=1 Tax=Aphanomyces astaci TaxID=112090 RepID=W4GG99_APHAT|nr:hypothetical protein H257_07886 [Aphanomyces astaci]ETV78301.1 hypothetical protein H257_07886 [Aphanomyces astaci]|eukprot:XP_009831882.1 hypothetical protein H257_07886 [Aphanomyces astaci]
MPDPILRTKPTLLVEADALATLAHQLLPLTNYAHLIIPDSWELRGEHDRPVTRATAPWLGSVYGRRDWPKAQAKKPDTRRRTVQPLRLPTGDISVLPKACLPDQDIYIPGHCTAIAHLLPGFKRPQWKTRGGNPSPNTSTCMIPLTPQRCVHAIHMQCLLGSPRPVSLMLAASQLSSESHQCPKPGSKLPWWLYQTALHPPTCTMPLLDCGPSHCLHWAQTSTPVYDQYALDARPYLTATIPAIYQATSG